MKVFISWAGERSRRVSELLDNWLRCVVQASRPWVSTRGIDRGAIWFSEISEQLRDTNVGIICLTGENKDRPWIMFEAGALAKGISQARVCPILIDLDPTDVKDPLAQFNLTAPDEEGMFKLVGTINSACPDPLPYETLRRSFDASWGVFKNGFEAIIAATPATEVMAPRPADDILAEILLNTRSLSSRIKNLEGRNLSNSASEFTDRSRSVMNEEITKRFNAIGRR